jgi:guanine nucleotide-binding protein subunit alpha
MKLIYSQGFTKGERLEWKPVVFSNIVQSFKTIHEAMAELNIEFETPENEKNMAQILVDAEISAEERMPPTYLEPIKVLWADGGVRAAIAKGNEYALHDNLGYFVDDIDRIWAPDYVPNDQDLLRSRLRTTGITETIFDLGQLTYRMFDVGGQRSERKKWIHCFENVNCLLFLVAISGYDQCLVEDKDGVSIFPSLLTPLGRHRAFDSNYLGFYSHANWCLKESNERSIDAVGIHCQFALVHQVRPHPLP